MKPIYESATKVVLLMITLGTIAGLFVGVISEETFKNALIMVLSFYFGGKVKTTTPEKVVTDENSDIIEALKSLK